MAGAYLHISGRASFEPQLSMPPLGGHAMSNDAKLGLVVGIGLVVLIAIVFFRKDPAQPPTGQEANAPAQVQSPSALTVPPSTDPRTAAPTLPRSQLPSEPAPLYPTTPSPQPP